MSFELRLVPVDFASYQRHDLHDDAVDIEPVPAEIGLLHLIPDARDDLRGSFAGGFYITDGLAKLIHVERLGVQHPGAGTRVGNDRGQRLIDLVCDGSAQFIWKQSKRCENSA